jgi:hypothetical protein
LSREFIVTVRVGKSASRSAKGSINDLADVSCPPWAALNNPQMADVLQAQGHAG